MKGSSRRLFLNPPRGSTHFEYVDMPRWKRFWKRAARGARLYFILWQLAAARKARQLGNRMDLQIAWHLTWAKASFRSVAAVLPHTFVFGPALAHTQIRR